MASKKQAQAKETLNSAIGLKDPSLLSFGLRMAKVVKIDDSDATVQRARSLLNTLDSYRGRLAVAVKSSSIELLQQSLAEAAEIGIALEAELEARDLLNHLVQQSKVDADSSSASLIQSTIHSARMLTDNGNSRVTASQIMQLSRTDCDDTIQSTVSAAPVHITVHAPPHSLSDKPVTASIHSHSILNRHIDGVKESLVSARLSLESARSTLMTSRSARLSARRIAASTPLFRRTKFARATKVTVLAGDLEPGYLDGSRNADGSISSLFDTPQSICQLDADTILIADRNNSRIRSFSISTGHVSTFAGRQPTDADVSEDTLSTTMDTALLISPSALCADPDAAQNVLVCTDGIQKFIKRISQDGYVSHVAGKMRSLDLESTEINAVWSQMQKLHSVDCLDAAFSDISGITFGTLNTESEPMFFIACMESCTVKSFNPRTGEIRRLLDESFEVLLKTPFNLAVDSFGRLIISCLEDCTIYRFDPSAPANFQLTCIAGKSGQQSFIDGDGPTQALLGAVSGIAIDPWDTIFFADYSHGAIRAVAPNGQVYSVVCVDPNYTSVAFDFNAPFGVIFDEYSFDLGAPRLFVCDFHRLIQVDLDPQSFPDIIPDFFVDLFVDTLMIESLSELFTEIEDQLILAEQQMANVHDPIPSISDPIHAQLDEVRRMAATEEQDALRARFAAEELRRKEEFDRLQREASAAEERVRSEVLAEVEKLRAEGPDAENERLANARRLVEEERIRRDELTKHIMPPLVLNGLRLPITANSLFSPDFYRLESSLDLVSPKSVKATAIEESTSAPDIPKSIEASTADRNAAPSSRLEDISNESVLFSNVHDAFSAFLSQSSLADQSRRPRVSSGVGSSSVISTQLSDYLQCGNVSSQSNTDLHRVRLSYLGPTDGRSIQTFAAARLNFLQCKLMQPMSTPVRIRFELIGSKNFSHFTKFCPVRGSIALFNSSILIPAAGHKLVLKAFLETCETVDVSTSKTDVSFRSTVAKLSKVITLASVTIAISESAFRNHQLIQLPFSSSGHPLAVGLMTIAADSTSVVSNSTVPGSVNSLSGWVKLSITQCLLNSEFVQSSRFLQSRKLTLAITVGHRLLQSITRTIAPEIDFNQEFCFWMPESEPKQVDISVSVFAHSEAAWTRRDLVAAWSASSFNSLPELWHRAFEQRSSIAALCSAPERSNATVCTLDLSVAGFASSALSDLIE